MYSTSFLTSYNNADQVDAENHDFNPADDIAAQIDVQECYQSPEEILKMRHGINSLSSAIQQHMHKLKDETEHLPQTIQRCYVNKKDQYVNVQHSSEELRNEICSIEDKLKNVMDEESSLRQKNNVKINAEDFRVEVIQDYRNTAELTQKNTKVLSELNN